MNFFKLYIGDYQRDTAHLSVTEHGAYMLMLQHYYATEKPLPTGKALHRMLRAQDKAERDAIDAVASQFWRTTDAGLVNDRADQEITKAGEQAETNRRIAVEREDKRKAAREKHEQSTNRATNGQPNQTPDTRHQTSFPEADASAAGAAPLTARDRVWALGPPLLGEKAKPFLGKLATTYGEELLADVLAEATRDKPIEPKAWVTAACIARGKPKANGNHAETAEDMLADPKPAWALSAGFQDRFQAESAGCTQGNAHRWRNGVRA